MGPGCDAWMWRSLSFRCPGGGFGLQFGRLFGDPGVTVSGSLGYRKKVGILQDTLGTGLVF